MNKLRIQILENDFKSLYKQIEDLKDMREETRYTLKEAYKDADASLSDEDAYQMVKDLTEEFHM